MSLEVIQLWVVGVVIVAIFVAMALDWASPDIIAMTGLVVVLACQILQPAEMLLVFSNSAPITIGALFVLSAALDRTGVIDQMGKVFLRLAGTSELRALLVLMIMAAGLSAFVNNTPVVVVFLPIILEFAKKTGVKASRLLIPLSFAAMLGGTCTLIGSSTNLLISGLASQMGERSFGMFEFAKLGMIYASAGILYLITVGRRFLPHRDSLSTLIDISQNREFLMEATVGTESELIGKSVPDSPFAKMSEARIIEVLRSGSRVEEPLNELIFEAGDKLLLKLLSSKIEDVQEIEGLLFSGKDKDRLGLIGIEYRKAQIMEGVLGPHSSMIGKSLAEMNFRQKYGAIILAVHRQGENLCSDFQNLKLAFGDTLLVEGPIDGISRLRDERDFVSLTEPKQRTFRRSRAPVAIAAILAVVGLSALNVLPIVTLAVIAAVMVVLLGCLTAEEAYRSVDWKILFLIFGMLGVSLAVERTGGAELIAHSALGLLGGFGPLVFLAAVYLVTSLITELISNNATAVLLAPLVIQIAHELGLDARPFIIAIMFAASACFATPIGYQTNTYIYGAGGYRFSDFPRVGILLNLLLWIVAIVFIPLLFPFQELD